MSRHKQQQPVIAYSFGYILSTLLTIIAFLIVMNARLTGWGLTLGLSLLAIIQLGIQLMFFLHLGGETKPRWKLMTFLFAAFAIFIVVIGSLWIMQNLDYNMTPRQVDRYIQNEEGIYKNQ